MIVKVMAVAVLANTVSVSLNRDFVTALNTALNFASWFILIRAQRALRQEFTPKLDRVEEVVTSTLDSSQPGGRRQHDPPKDDHVQ